MIMAEYKESTSTGRIVRLGYLQRKILAYALLVSDRFTPSDILVYYEMKNQKMQRRVYDAIKRLERRGVLEKITRGLYRLNQHVDLSMSDLQILRGDDRKETDFSGKLIKDCAVVRIHAIGAKGLLHLLFCFSFLRYMSAGALKQLQQYMEQLFPRRVVRDVEFRAKMLAQSVVASGEFILGAHGRYGIGCRQELFPIALVDQFSFREVGVDIVVPRGLLVPKLHMKFYTSRSPYVDKC
jgi:hypothetical protein